MVFSIIVPVYNAEDYLNACVESVLNQTFTDFELILVDDGSPDSCPQMCDDWASKDNRIKVIHKKNGGASDARNAGMDLAKGGYILFLDSDDFYNSKETLETLYGKIDKNNADVVIFGCTDWNMQTNQKIISRTGYDLALIEKGDNRNTLHYLLSQKMIPGGPTIFCTKRALIEENSIRFKLGIQDEDYDYVLSIFSHCTCISAVDNPFYTYRKGLENSVTGSFNLKMINGIDYTLDKWLPICNKMSDEVLKRDFLNYIAFIYTTGFVVMGNMDRQERKKAMPIMKKHKDILKFGYWRKTRIIKLASKMLGMNLFSILSAIYFDKTHI